MLHIVAIYRRPARGNLHTWACECRRWVAGRVYMQDTRCPIPLSWASNHCYRCDLGTGCSVEEYQLWFGCDGGLPHRGGNLRPPGVLQVCPTDNRLLPRPIRPVSRSEEHTYELQSPMYL